MQKMQENTDQPWKILGGIINECMVLSALDSTALALESGLRKDQIIISCKVSRPLHLIAVYRELAKKNRSTAAPGADREPAWASRVSSGPRRRWARCSTKGSATRFACR